jgi:hypothetical protein
VNKTAGSLDVFEHGFKEGGEFGVDIHLVATEEGSVVGVAQHGGEFLVFVALGEGEEGVANGLVAQRIEFGQFVGANEEAPVVVLAQQEEEDDSHDGQQQYEGYPEDGEVGTAILVDDKRNGDYYGDDEEYVHL